MDQVHSTDSTTYRRSVFSVPKMDCPSEENLIRMALNDRTIQSLSFDLAKREMAALHRGEPEDLLSRLQPLKLGAELRSSELTRIPENAERLESLFAIPKMDCPSEENLVRMALGDLDAVASLVFDLPHRQLRVVHSGPAEPILDRLSPLQLGATLQSSKPSATPESASGALGTAEDASEAKTLRLLLGINAVMFFFELTLGWLAQSAGLIADSLDMFADAAVYGVALYAVGRAAHLKTRAAHFAGWLQLVLAIGALSEVIRRFMLGSEPESALMMSVGLVALVANVTCLALIAKKRGNGAHMKASYIFSANDVLANLGVIVAGVLVTWTGSGYPDLIIGTVIGFIVLNGARRILQLK